MKRAKRALKLSLVVFLGVFFCIPFTIPTFAESSAARTASAATASEPSASQVSAPRLTIPKGAVMDDLSKEPSENPSADATAGAATVQAKKLPSGADYHILNANTFKPQGSSRPTDIWNWSDGTYYGTVAQLGGVYTNYCFQPSSIGKLWINTDFESDTAIGYSFQITCYDRTTGREAVSWSSKTAPGGHSSPSAVSFYNLNKNHTYFFEFANTQGYGGIDGDFDIEPQNS